MSMFEWMTREGFDKLKAELDHLKNVKRPEIARTLEKARAHGDFRENAEFDSAKHQQMLLEARIAQLEEKLSRGRIHEPGPGDGTARLGARVRLRDLKRDDIFEYSLVSAEEADAGTGKISVQSPVGRALLGLKTGDIAEIHVPAGTLRYEVLNIKF
ncbi:MAG: transcription elongation factor GreA [Candidatus Abyssobacteria bacterium SURF_5]|uniref:Transcription elongation factor GreA n=1 Tax=Abyssobacteria bacterium (strain SURF_5) TaxID=2093360 RepID=A0A3A4P408_ABYX5|nr:MAG: transcription elongation factor GreA [Candidatus Abyssubacteria bacterium SURF_5]